GSLAVFPLRFLSSMAVGGALVALSAAAVSLVSLTALLHVLGDRVNALAPRRWQHASAGGTWARIAASVMRRPAAGAAVSGGVLGALTLPALGVRVAGIDASALPKSASARQVADALDARGLRGRASPLNLVLRERPSPDEIARVRLLPGVASTVGPEL